MKYFCFFCCFIYFIFCFLSSDPAPSPHAADGSSSSAAHAHQHPVLPRPPQHDLRARRGSEGAPRHHTSTNKRAGSSPAPCTQDPPSELQREQPQRLRSAGGARGSGEALPLPGPLQGHSPELQRGVSGGAEPRQVPGQHGPPPVPLQGRHLRQPVQRRLLQRVLELGRGRQREQERRKRSVRGSKERRRRVVRAPPQLHGVRTGPETRKTLHCKKRPALGLPRGGARFITSGAIQGGHIKNNLTWILKFKHGRHSKFEMALIHCLNIDSAKTL